MLKIGLPKGNIKKKSIALAKTMLNEDYDDSLLHFCKDDIEVFLLKQRDIPQLLDNGILDIGITSTEWITEKEVDLTIEQYLDWCDTRISLITPSNHMERPLKTCVTEYPQIASRFFNENKMTDTKIITLSGSSEALVPYVYDCCIDCVETGGTLKHNGLVEKTIIFEAKTVLVYKTKSTKVSNFIQEMKKYL